MNNFQGALSQLQQSPFMAGQQAAPAVTQAPMQMSAPTQAQLYGSPQDQAQYAAASNSKLYNMLPQAERVQLLGGGFTGGTDRRNDWLNSQDASLLGMSRAQKDQGGGDAAALMQEMAKLGISGNTAGSAQELINRMAPDLARYGVQSLSDLRPQTITGPSGKPTQVFINQRTGQLVPVDFGSSMKGEGGSYYNLATGPNGQVTVQPHWENTSDRDAIAGGLSILGFAAGLSPLGSMLGSATGLGTTAGNALVSAGSSALQGGVSGGWKGALTGALASGAGSAIGALNPAQYVTDNATLQSALNKGLSGATGASLKGGDPLSGALSGALSGGLGQQYGALGGMAGGMLGNYLARNYLNNGQASQPNMQAALGSTSAPAQNQTGIPPSVLAQIREMQSKIQANGGSGSGLDKLANWGQTKLGWT
jgi:hypothetical protein